MSCRYPSISAVFVFFSEVVSNWSFILGKF